MSALFVDTAHLQLSSDGQVLQVRDADGHIQRQIPFALLDRVVLRARCQLDSQVLSDLARHGVMLLALHGRAGQNVAQLSGALHNDSRRRWAQVLTFLHPFEATAFARAIVHAKLRAQRRILGALLAQRPDLRKPLFDACQQLQASARSLPPASATNLDQLRGIEGAAAAVYFPAYFRAFAPKLQPTQRSRRPPRDPVNALLSLGYTLLHAQAVNACWAAGLDPAMGALHAPAHARAALACDLMEPWRPLVDLWVWQLMREQTLRSEHFAHDGAGACLLGKAGRAHFWPLWNHQAPIWQKQLDRWAQAIARVVLRRGHIPPEWDQPSPTPN